MKNFNVNLEKMIKLQGFPIAIAAAILFTNLTECGKKEDCNIVGNHAHLYTNEEGYKAYYNKEYKTYDGYERQEEYIPLTVEKIELYNFLEKNDLISIEDNLDAIIARQGQNHDYNEYRYSYIKFDFVRYGKRAILKPVTNYSWTSNSSHSGLTGEIRLCHYVYQAFNVVKDKNGKYVLVPSKYADDIRDLVEDYDYVKKVFYKVVNAENYLDLDYEDGPDLEDVFSKENVETQYYVSSKRNCESQKRLFKSLT